MKILQNVLLILCLILVSCSSSDPTACKDKVCTMEFRMVSVRFVDDTGNPQVVKDYSAVNKRTGRSMTPNYDNLVQGFYVVASDSDLKELSEKGDIVLVSATNPKNNTKVTAEFVISGGICICHISKISGPETIKI